MTKNIENGGNSRTSRLAYAEVNSLFTLSLFNSLPISHFPAQSIYLCMRASRNVRGRGKEGKPSNEATMRAPYDGTQSETGATLWDAAMVMGGYFAVRKCYGIKLRRDTFRYLSGE